MQSAPIFLLLAFLLGLAGCAPPEPVIPPPGEPLAVPSPDLLPAADHHVHIRSADATVALRRVQEAVGQQVAGELAPSLAVVDLLAALDEAGIERAAVFSVAYMFGIPDVAFENERELVRAENDYVAGEVNRHPTRLVGFCSVNPLAPYALEEVDRCAELESMVGIKLHLANSAADLLDEEHLAVLGDLFSRANELGLALAVHMRTRNPEYGRADAEVFIREVLARSPDVTVQIAHMAGWGGFDEATASAVGAFVDLLAVDPEPFEDRLFFDLAETVVPPQLASGDPELLAQVAAINRGTAETIRRIGPERVLFGTDWFGAGRLPLSARVEAVRNELGLSAPEIEVLLTNIAPYLR